ncbi:MAG: helix-turn-helix domain-containing protein [Thermomicrobiales bacterium]
MALRGEALREHIILSAKAVFLEQGFERTSMDEVAARAGSSKRTLYVHFGTKDALFQAVIDLVRVMYGGRIRSPESYSADPVEAVACFCVQFRQMLLWDPILLNCRLVIAESGRLPTAGAELYDIFFVTTQRKLAAYLETALSLDPVRSQELASQLLGSAAYPPFLRGLFGLEPGRPDKPGEAAVTESPEFPAIRRVVGALLREELARASDIATR